MLVAPACGGDGGGEADKPSKAAISDAPQVSGREAIPPARELGDPEPGIILVPRLAPDDDVTTRAVAPGDRFEFYVCALHAKRDMASATYRLAVPEGVEILGEAKQYPESLSIGTYDQYFAVTYPCHAGDEYYPVLRYSCMVTPSFTGGEIRVEKAVPLDAVTQPRFLGFVSCGDSPDMYPAAGGALQLTLK